MSSFDSLPPEPVARLAEVMGSYTGRWSLAGGWAVDAWVGRTTREHQDVDIATFREDERLVFTELGHHRLVAHDHPDDAHDTPWDGRPLGFPAHLHSALPDGLEWEIQFNERAGSRWLVSREPRLVLPLDDFARPTRWRVPALAPHVVLWYKAIGALNPKDDHDLRVLAPVLRPDERRWTSDALAALRPQHRWLDALR